MLFPTGARPNFIDKVMTLCNECGFTPNISQEVGDAVTGVALVASGFGVCPCLSQPRRCGFPA